MEKPATDSPTAQNPLWSAHHERSDTEIVPASPIHGRLVPPNPSPYEISGLGHAGASGVAGGEVADHALVAAAMPLSLALEPFDRFAI